MSRLAQITRDERGNAFIEMGLLLPLFAALLVGTVDISRAYSERLNLEQAAQRAVEKVQIKDYTQADKATMKTEAETAAGTGSTATVSDWLQCGTSTTKLGYTDSCSSGAVARFVQVSITRNYTPLFASALFGGKNSDGTVTIRGVAGIRVQ
jgi:Flp pilus assembly protein TadG